MKLPPPALSLFFSQQHALCELDITADICRPSLGGQVDISYGPTNFPIQLLKEEKGVQDLSKEI